MARRLNSKGKTTENFFHAFSTKLCSCSVRQTTEPNGFILDNNSTRNVLFCCCQPQAHWAKVALALNQGLETILPTNHDFYVHWPH